MPEPGPGRDAPPHRSLSPETLLGAYASGAFPMDVPGARGAVAYYEADPRAVMPISGFRVPRSVARGLRRAGFEIRVDADFAAVAAACGEGRAPGTWLTPRLVDAYVRLHALGYAHSVEAWRDRRLRGGLFGVAIGGLFTSESMFHRAPDAGNAVLVATARLLAAGGFTLWDIQMASEHTARFGAREIGRGEYMRLLEQALALPHRRLGAPPPSGPP